MKTCFNCEMKITQKFGNVLIENGKEYYAQWGMKGHNGIDVVPVAGSKDVLIYSFYAGEIVQILRNHPDYGNGIRIYMPELDAIECHNHMGLINPDLKLFDIVSKKQLLGLMGNTGASLGAHDHIGFAKVGATCFRQSGELFTRLNMNNGYLGYIDPMPFLG